MNVYFQLRTLSEQKPIGRVGCIGILKDFFDKKHAEETVKTLSKKRNQHRRMFLWICLIATFFYTFQRDEKNYTFLYTKDKFGWGISEFSNFKTLQSATQNVILFIGVPVMTKLLKLRDTSIAMVGAFFFAAARIIFTFANVPELFYVGAVISSVGPVSGPILRSMASKIVPLSERGKVFATLAVCDNAGPMISSIFYTQIYNWTLGIFAGIFVLTAITQMILFCLML